MMMENSDKAVKGFNSGYLLQKFEPEVAKVLMASLAGVEAPYFQGLLAGSKQLLLEKDMEKYDLYPSLWDDLDIDETPDMNKDDIDMDLDF